MAHDFPLESLGGNNINLFTQIKMAVSMIEDTEYYGVEVKRGKQIYPQRKEMIERVFTDAKEKHAMRYTHHRGLVAVTKWVRLKFAAMNLKKLANGAGIASVFLKYWSYFGQNTTKPLFSSHENRGSLTGLGLAVETASPFLMDEKGSDHDILQIVEFFR